MKNLPLIIASIFTAALLGEACAAPDHGGAQHHGAEAPMAKEQKAWGVAGDARAVARTISIRMGDDMRFAPRRIELREGETVRLRAENVGQLPHEIVLGAQGELDAHAEAMQQQPGMAHDAPHMAHVDAGRKGEIVWTFNRPGRFDFACLVPGHAQAGMTGTITVLPRKGS